MKNHSGCTGHCECGCVSGEVDGYCRDCGCKIVDCDGENPMCGG